MPHAAFSFGRFDCPECRSVCGWERRCCSTATVTRPLATVFTLCLPRSAACVHQSITRSNDSADRDESILHREHDSNSRPPSPSSHSHSSLSALTMKQSPLLCYMIRLLCSQSPPGQQRKARAQCTVYSICNVLIVPAPPAPSRRGVNQPASTTKSKRPRMGKCSAEGKEGHREIALRFIGNLLARSPRD